MANGSRLVLRRVADSLRLRNMCQEAPMAKVLVVEDEDDIRQLLIEDLEGRGHRVRGAGNGLIAIQQVKQRMPDIIFVDIMMPIMDGFDLILKLRENPETAAIPMVLVTAMNARDAEGKARELGVEHFLLKYWEPWSLDFVLDQIPNPKSTARKGDGKLQVYPQRAPERSTNYPSAA
ncbi:MAG: hypothetical protein CL732_07425 [Chloroflexi bacterium]|nr:hypothetical protein [Chloroflexota bacterium]